MQTAHSPNLYKYNTWWACLDWYKPHSSSLVHSPNVYKQHIRRVCTNSTPAKHVHMAHSEIMLIQAAPSPRLQGQHTHQSKYPPACGATTAEWGWPSRRVPWLSSGCPPLHLYSSSWHWKAKTDTSCLTPNPPWQSERQKEIIHV